MAIDITKLANRLKEFESDSKQSEAQKYLWKPKEGLQTVRIVPYKFNPDSPFIELQFYYKLAGKNYLAPCTFGKPDPIMEFVDSMRSSGIQADRELAKKIEPKSRTYAPVIVRGEEDLGVRFWGFGVTVYKQLLTLITDSEWGDITSLTEGNDIKVEFHKESSKRGKDGKSFPETKLTPSPRKTSVVDPTRPELVQKVKDQINILTCWPMPTYDELKSALDKYLNPESIGDEDVDTDAEEIVIPQVSQANTPVQSTTQPPADLGKAFEEFFSK